MLKGRVFGGTGLAPHPDDLVARLAVSLEPGHGCLQSPPAHALAGPGQPHQHGGVSAETRGRGGRGISVTVHNRIVRDHNKASWKWRKQRELRNED